MDFKFQCGPDIVWRDNGEDARASIISTNDLGEIYVRLAQALT